MTVKREALHDVAKFLRDEPSLQFDYIVHVSSVDWPDDEERFEVVYEFYSFEPVSVFVSKHGFQNWMPLWNP